MVGESSPIHSFDNRESRREVWCAFGQGPSPLWTFPRSRSVCVIPSRAYAPSLNPGMTESLGDCLVQHAGFAEGETETWKGWRLV